MEEIIRNISEAIELVNKASGQLLNEVSKIITANEKLVLREQALRDAQEALKKREDAVAKIESIVDLENSTKDRLAEIKVKNAELVNAQNKFDEYVRTTTKELDAVTKKNEEVIMHNKISSDALIKERARLEEEKRTYKLRMAQGIVDQADKR
jgi:hypothetical protein